MKRLLVLTVILGFALAPLLAGCEGDTIVGRDYNRYDQNHNEGDGDQFAPFATPAEEEDGAVKCYSSRESEGPLFGDALQDCIDGLLPNCFCVDDLNE
jgi:hypothetical protein